MNKSALIQKLEPLISPICDELSYELYHVEYVKEDGDYFLRIYIDKPGGGISLTDCEAVSRRVSDMLDIEDPIKDSYYLEVSSPGLNRNLYTDEHFKKFTGREVIIKLSSAIDGTKTVKGILESIDDEYVTVKGDTELNIPKGKIKSANLDGEI